MPLHTTHIKLTPTATGSAPSGAEGTVYYDSSVNALRQYSTSYRSTFPVYSIELLMVAGGGGGNVDLNSLNTMFVNRTAFDDL